MIAVDVVASDDETVRNAAMGAMRIHRRLGADARLTYRGIRLVITPHMSLANVIEFFEANMPKGSA